jgi:hypothetical protein
LELLEYDPMSGIFTNRIKRWRAKAGTRAGSPYGRGYRGISLDGLKYYEHHLAWLIVHGGWPASDLDHIDGNHSNNSIANLRLATASQNLANGGGWANGSSGLRGVYLDRRRLHVRAWRAQIQVDGRAIHLGSYYTPEEAHAAYLKAANLYFGKYARHNRAQQPTMEICQWLPTP